MGNRYMPSELSAGFSDAVIAETSTGDLIFISGQLGVGLPPAKSGDELNFEDEVRACFMRITEALSKAGAETRHVVKLQAFLTDLSLYSIYSKVRSEFFPESPPSSTAIGVAALLFKARVEVDAQAFVDRGLA